jgi:Uma2 family endonuclease
MQARREQATIKPYMIGLAGWVHDREGTVLDGVFYPGEDGQPMGESGLHGDEIIRVYQTVDDYFAADPRVFVTRDMLLYYQEGNPNAVVVPDVMVTLGIDKLPVRTSYFVWLEEKAPDVVVEIASRSTRTLDHREKRQIYARIGVAEYVLYDPAPTGGRPPLVLLRLRGDGYQPVAPDGEGLVRSERLQMALRIEGGRLRLYDARTGAMLRSPVERTLAAERRADAAELRAEALDQALATERARVAELEWQLREARGQA